MFYLLHTLYSKSTKQSIARVAGSVSYVTNFVTKSVYMSTPHNYTASVNPHGLTYKSANEIHHSWSRISAVSALLNDNYRIRWQ